MFGTPNEGSHAHRFLGMATIDLVLTIIIGLILMWLTGSAIALFALFGAGILAHRLFCVRTAVDKFLFPNY